MLLDDIRQRFVDEIKLRAYDDGFVDKNEEREILQIAIHQGVAIESARDELIKVCEAQGFVMESALMSMARDRLAVAGPIDRAAFDGVCQALRAVAKSTRNDRDIKKLVLVAMEDAGLVPTRTGWFGGWFAAVKREVAGTR